MTTDESDTTSPDLPLIAPDPLVAEWDAKAERIAMPLHEGAIVWRKWGAGPPIVFFHGGSGSWTHWIRNIPELSKRFTVFAIDLPGMGDSGWFSGDELDLRPGERSDFRVPLKPEWQPPPITMPALSRRLASDIEKLIPDERITLVGFSFGGMTAANVTAHIPHKVSRLVLVGAAGVAERNPAMKKLATWRFASTAQELWDVQRENVGVLMIHDPARIDDLAVNIQVSNGQRTQSRKTPRYPTTLDALRRARPKLGAIWGRFDSISGWQIDEIRKTLREIDPDCPLHVVESGGHWVAFECADEFNRALTDMLTR